MANIRLNRIKVSNSTTIKAEFTADLNLSIGVNNIVITSGITGIPDVQVLSVVVSGPVLIISTRPLTPFSAYNITFQSATNFPFNSRDGQSFLFQDGVTNVAVIYGPADPDDPIKDILSGYLQNNIYSLDPGTIADDVLNLQSSNLSGALHDIGQLKNDNYLEVLITDEVHVRGSGPYDRLNEEGAFELVRVGLDSTGSTTSTEFNFDSFPDNPVTLLKASITNEKLLASNDSIGFDDLIFTVTYFPVTKLTGLKVLYQLGGTATYDIDSFGYQLKNPNYDTDHASTYLLLNDNQIRLSEAILNSGFILPKSGDTVLISYEFKSLGRIVDETSIVVSQIIDAVREVVPPIKNDFSLQNALIVNADGTTPTSNGVVFLDPLSNPPFSATHPAFTTEIPYRLERLPSFPGEFAVDYPTGRVFVFGQTALLKDGSGNFPPTATYKYQKLYDNRLDYTYNDETSDLVANPLRELITQPVNINFNYEQTLIPGIDFKAQIHEEIINERILNNLLTLGSLGVQNTPITNAFRVFNETSGEIYTISRFNDNTVFFTSNNAPRILDVVRERPIFTDVLNEILIVNTQLVNGSSVLIYKITLENNDIISGTEDSIGSSFNSSAFFSRTDIFETELYFDAQELSLTNNLNRITIGLYQIDYRNGIVYVGVSNAQDLDIGTINYKKSTVTTSNDHIISVSNIYYSITPLKGVNKTVSYTGFTDTEISPTTFDISDERFLNGDLTLPYIVSSGTIMVMDNIKNVRGVYDAFDLNNHEIPTNFASSSTSSSNIISLDPNGIQIKNTLNIGTLSEVTVPFISNGANIVGVTSVIRISDGAQLWDNGGTFSGYVITLSGVNSPIINQQVIVIYNVQLNGGATPIVDYNRGDYFIDYSYLADEILVSYEYGDNLIDFRESDALDEGEQYFVTYKVGALRDALLKNFGTLVNLPIMNSFDTSLARENYRDALQGALQSFTKGPTIVAIKELVSSITKIDPEITESVFDIWSLGISRLFQNRANITGTPTLLAAKFDNGVLLDQPGQTISFPMSSNLRLDGGSLGMWVYPEWNGLDNDATLTFTKLIKDGYSVLASNIYIGSDSHNPVFDSNGNFTVNRTDIDSPIGLPSAVFTKIGLFIYYDDVAKRWDVLANESTSSNHVYSGQIQSSGEVYDAKFIQDLGETGDVLRSHTNKIDFVFNIGTSEAAHHDGYEAGDGYVAGVSFDGITFMADDLHYFFDFAKDTQTERFSLYKDGRGYLNFEVWDKGGRKRKNSYRVSADISNWSAGEPHLIGIAWKLNSSDRKDEMHLFVDGFEVPNIMRYGGRPIASSTDRFRTVVPEIIAGAVTKKSILGNDLTTNIGSNIVTSATVDFQLQGIAPGDTIEILELGFEQYNIISVSGFSLTLNSTMPTSFTDARFSVNEVSVIVSSEIDTSSNIAVSILDGTTETEIPGLRADLPSYRISQDALNNNILTILGNANPGDQIIIRTLGLNHRRCRETVYIYGNTTNVLKTQLPPPINLDEVKIYAVMLPLTIIGPSNSTIVSGKFVSTTTVSQPSNSSQGRTLAVRMTGGNVDFTTPATVSITGVDASGPATVILSFSSATTQNTAQKWKTISSITTTVKPINTSQNSVGIEIKEAFSITNSENNTLFPVIRFSFKTQNGVTLSSTGTAVVTDLLGLFADSDVGNKIIISSPGPAVGTYMITARIDENNVVISPTPPAFTNGVYSIYNVSIGRSGFQNGFFTLETAGMTNVPYNLNQGYFDFDYTTDLEVSFNPIGTTNLFIGSDFTGNHQAKATIDDFRILSNMITDVRVGESIAVNQKSFTTDFTAIRPFVADQNTLMLLTFDDNLFINTAPFYTMATRDYVQSGESVNPNFNQSVVIEDTGLVFDNAGLLTTDSEGSIEFWVSPRFDTYNDPMIRFYFDASGSFIEQDTSITSGTVKVSNTINQVIAVRLVTDTDNSGVNYFAGGSIAADFKTINLGTALPYQQTPVKIIYIPAGLEGNRLSIYKDSVGFITFNVHSGSIDYQVRQPVFWARDTWHRVKATFLFNSANNRDEIRLFVDGEERGVILFGTGLVFGTETVFGQGLAGLTETRLITDINFTDPINNIYIGSDYLSANTAQARIDNFKISNIRQPSFILAGQAKDINYSSNTSILFPVITDAFTTFLMDFDQLITEIDDFAILRDELYGIFNFTLQIIDSFGIVMDNAKLKQVLEALIFALKPAQSKVDLEYIT